MSETTYNRHCKTNCRFFNIPLLGNVVVAGLGGVLFGLVDFFLFETQSNHPVMQEFVLSKPGFWSLSLLSYQVVTLTLLAYFLCLAVFLATRILFKRFEFFKSFSPLFFTYLSIFSILFTLRFLKNSEQHLKLSLLIIWFVISIVTAFFVRKKILNSFKDSGYRHSNVLLICSFVTTLIIVSSSFLAPDIDFTILENSKHTPAHESKYPNVLLVVLDTVRMDHLSCYGYTQNETPNIDRMSREGLLFLNAFSTAPWTVPSHASMFTGLHTFQHHADWGHTYLASDYLTLAEYLSGLGYRTAGFSENPFVGPNTGLARGFAEFHESWRRPMIVRAINKLCARLGFRKDPLEYADRTSGLLRHWLKDESNRGRPFFAFVNFMAAHLPRYPRQQAGDGRWPSETLMRIEPVNLVPERFYLESYRLDQSDLSVMKEIYDQEISYIDEYLGNIFDFLDEQKILDNTILIITGDHGENFGEHGFIEHQLCIYDSLIHVPLIIRFPKLFSASNH